MKPTATLKSLLAVIALTGVIGSAVAAPILKVPAVLNVSGQSSCVQNPGTLYGRQNERRLVETACLPAEALRQQQDEKGMVSLTVIRDLWEERVPGIEVVGNEQIQLIQSKPESAIDLSSKAQQWLVAKLQARFESVVVEPDRIPSVTATKGQLQWQVRESEVFPKSRHCVWMDGLRGGRIQSSLPVCFRVQAKARVPVYNQDLAANDVLDPQRIGQQTVDVTTLPGEPAELIPDLHYVAVGPVIAGTALLATDVRLRPDVIQGKAVTIVSQVGGVAIMARGVALEEGRVGDMVRVKADHGAESFKARVEGADQVKIGGDA